MVLASAQTLEAFMLNHPDQLWEVHRGQLREKPAMSESHNRVLRRLARARELNVQLDPDRYEVAMNMGRVRWGDDTYYIPDVYVIPIEPGTTIRDQAYRLEVFDRPLPFVAEGWSPSTGNYDVDGKLPRYKDRGDREIWRLHPFDLMVSAWQRQPDGSYDEVVLRSEKVQLIALPGVMIDLDLIFA
jgi:Uma2 family endonuclease